MVDPIIYNWFYNLYKTSLVFPISRLYLGIPSIRLSLFCVDRDFMIKEKMVADEMLRLRKEIIKLKAFKAYFFELNFLPEKMSKFVDVISHFKFHCFLYSCLFLFFFLQLYLLHTNIDSYGPVII